MDVKIIAKSFSQHDEKYVVPTSLIGIRVGKRKSCILSLNSQFKMAENRFLLLTSMSIINFERSLGIVTYKLKYVL
jgi:hypothetical protein